MVTLLLEEKRIEIRTVNVGMAKRARLELSRLIMEGRCGRSPAKSRVGVTLQAQQVHRAHA
jgi:hypothetical protein